MFLSLHAPPVVSLTCPLKRSLGEMLDFALESKEGRSIFLVKNLIVNGHLI
jgi:hypothetical protein|tara:strand:+ start:332 stop:484 length:153 start_codon:yes stop_codon:yes gene_type:complete